MRLRATADTRPNILVIMTDQQRRETVGCNPNAWIATPNLERLAREGVNFQRAYAACPICVPTRVTFMSGLHANRVWTDGVGSPMDNGGNVPDPDRTVASLLRRDGYTTAIVGKTHLKPYGCPLGFDESHLLENDPDVDYTRYLKRRCHSKKDFWHNCAYDGVFAHDTSLPFEDYAATWVTRWTNDYLRRQADARQPFFLWTSYFKPHNPYDPPAPYRGTIDPDTLPRPVRSEAEWQDKGRVYHERDAFYRARRKDAPVTEASIQEARARYCECVKMLDDDVGAIIATLEETGQWDNTTVIFTSDHGDLLGDHHLWHKTLAYEGSAGIPLLMRLPGETGAGQSTALAGTIDLAPTCLDMAGTPIPDDWQGRSLLPAYRETPDDWRDALYLECSYYPGTMTAICTDRWKYVHFVNGGEEELYDLAEDPDELKNRAADPSYGAERREMRRKLVELIRDEGPDWALAGHDLARLPFEPGYCRYSVHRPKMMPAPPGAPAMHG